GAAACDHVDDSHRHGMLRHRRQVVDGEGEDAAALAELVLLHAVARLAADADARLRVLDEAACLAAAAVETHVLPELLPLDHRRDRLAPGLGPEHAARAEIA